MNLSNRILKLEHVVSPEKITITTNLWDETKEPWPETEEQKKAYEAKVGMKCFWVEATRDEKKT